MRRLLESLTPQARQIYWKWVGGIFALYVVLLLTAAGVFVGHESSRKLAQEPVTTVAVDGKQRSVTETPASLRQAARHVPAAMTALKVPMGLTQLLILTSCSSADRRRSACRIRWDARWMPS